MTQFFWLRQSRLLRPSVSCINQCQVRTQEVAEAQAIRGLCRPIKCRLCPYFTSLFRAASKATKSPLWTRAVLTTLPSTPLFLISASHERQIVCADPPPARPLACELSALARPRLCSHHLSAVICKGELQPALRTSFHSSEHLLPSEGGLRRCWMRLHASICIRAD
jgi:hypothetical protein